MTSGLSEAGGWLAASGQAYAVNGEGPRSRICIAGAALPISNSVDGGFRRSGLLVDAISSSGIRHLTRRPKYGGTSGATTSVVTKSGGNQFHGDLEFLRNDGFDSRNFFAALRSHCTKTSSGQKIGGPIRRDHDFFFVYYEGFPQSAG